jgi:hypothetical protein
MVAEGQAISGKAKELGYECGAGMPCKCNEDKEPDTSGLPIEKPIKPH